MSCVRARAAVNSAGKRHPVSRADVTHAAGARSHHRRPERAARREAEVHEGTQRDHVPLRATHSYMGASAVAPHVARTRGGAAQASAEQRRLPTHAKTLPAPSYPEDREFVDKVKESQLAIAKPDRIRDTVPAAAEDAHAHAGEHGTAGGRRRAVDGTQTVLSALFRDDRGASIASDGDAAKPAAVAARGDSRVDWLRATGRALAPSRTAASWSRPCWAVHSSSVRQCWSRNLGQRAIAKRSPSFPVIAIFSGRSLTNVSCHCGIKAMAPRD